MVTLADTPTGQAGRPSKSLTLDQAVALITATAGTRIGVYIVLRLTTEIRTEEARALRWENIAFDNRDADPPVPASVDVWRSVRTDEDTKAERSRRTLQLPQPAVDALIELRRQTVGPRLVFCTRTGESLDAANVRREFRAARKTAGIGATWTPRNYDTASYR